MVESHALHKYIHGVLEKDDHGDYRHLSFDLPALNEVIDKHAERIASHIHSGVKNARPDEGERVTVSNNLGNVSFQCLVVEPHNLDELVRVMAQAKRENQNIKAVGGFYAFSPICETTGYLMKTSNLVGVAATPSATLKDPKQATGLYDVLCGTTLKDIVQALEKDGRALMNLGGFTGQGIVGATSTGTHGSGLTLPPLASMINSIHLVSAKFDPQTGLPIQYRIEPTDGITDPKRHHSASPSLVLIQDDNVFSSAVTSLGAFGVVYSVTLTSVPFYWIRETREMVDWPAARSVLGQGPQGGILSYHNAEVWVNPYTTKALITWREKVTVPPAGGLAEQSLSMFATLLEELPAFQAVKKALDETHIADKTSKELGIILAVFLRHFPLLVPSALDLAMTTQNHSEPKVAKYYDIYDIGSTNDFPAISTEISYPMATYISAADSTISLLQTLHKQNIFSAVTSPISLRFTAPTATRLSMSYSPSATSSTPDGRSYIEMPSLYYFHETVQGYEDISKRISDNSIDAFQGRLHWGQFIPPSFTVLRYQLHDPEFYSSIAAFKAVAEEFDPGHVMANDFLTRVIWLVVKYTVLVPLDQT